ncbi:hypothetical protein B0H14DRAFT_3454233 [Mycena olivaceomarginata]|nr:hypothetical protein B0H14DRAFT_3454233 [Mycena olivaceomarginata]
MPKGRKSPRSAEQTEFLESHLAEFMELQPRLTTFWVKVEKGWFQKWKVEDDLNLPTLGDGIEDCELSEEQQTMIGTAQAKMKQKIHNWFNNRSQKEKKRLNPGGSSSATEAVLKELVVKLGKSGQRKKQCMELFQNRNPDIVNDALKTAGFYKAMGTAAEGETADECKQRIEDGRWEQMWIRRQVVQQLYQEADEDEREAVETLFRDQKVPTGQQLLKAETPEDRQRGLDQLGPVLVNFHQAVHHMTGWVGTTMFTGPTPNENGKISTTSYSSGTTPAGPNFDTAYPEFHEQVNDICISDVKTRREHVIRPKTVSEATPTTADETCVTPSTPPTETAHEERQHSPSTQNTMIGATSSAADADTGVADKAAADIWDSLHVFGDAGDGNDAGDGRGVFGDDIPIDPVLLEASKPTEVYSNLLPAAKPTDTRLSSASSTDNLRPQQFQLTPLSANSASQTGLSSYLDGFVFLNERSPPAPKSSLGTLASQDLPSTSQHLATGAVRPPTSQSLTTAPPCVLPWTGPPVFRWPPPPASHPPSSPLRGLPLLAGMQISTNTTKAATPSPLRPSHSAEGNATVMSGSLTVDVDTISVPDPILTLTPEDFPESRPMCNLPPPPKTRGGGGSVRGSRRARGRGKGAHGGGGGGRGGAVRGGGGEIGDQEVEGAADHDQAVEDSGGVSNRMVPLPPNRLKEIRDFEKKRDAAAATAAKNRDHGIFHMEPIPDGHAGMPHGPAALGRRVVRPEPEPISLGARVRRPPASYEAPPPKRTMQEIRDAAEENVAPNDVPTRTKRRKTK